jgi:hypothetical protein
MNTPSSGAETLRRSRLQMILVGILFFMPFILAWLLYFQFPQLQPVGRLNRGELVDPARPLPQLDLRNSQNEPVPAQLFKGKWTIVQLGSAQCDAGCEKHLYMSRQVRTRLDRDARRVQRVYVAPDVAALVAVQTRLAAQHPDLIWVADAGAAGSRFADFLHPSSANALYIVDPLGNWMMLYAGLEAYPDFQQSTRYMQDIYTDLKRLLRLSQIDS